MKAITLWQPWASLIAEGVKTIETRSWPCPEALVGERIAIHAAARKGGWNDPRATDGVGIVNRSLGVAFEDWPRGAIVATACIRDCIPMDDDPDRNDHYLCIFDDHPGPHDRLAEYPAGWWDGTEDDIAHDDQLPYGDFAPGRWAWLLDDIEKLPEPIPAKGRQRIWNWEAA